MVCIEAVTARLPFWAMSYTITSRKWMWIMDAYLMDIAPVVFSVFIPGLDMLLSSSVFKMTLIVFPL